MESREEYEQSSNPPAHNRVLSTGSESGLRSEERLMKDNTSSVRGAAGRRGTACTKHGREAGEAAGSGGRGAVVSSAGDGAG